MKDCKGQEIAIGDYVVIMDGFRDRIYLIVPWAGEWLQAEDTVWVSLYSKPSQATRRAENGWAGTKSLLKIPEEYAKDQKKLDLYLKLGGMMESL